MMMNQEQLQREIDENQIDQKSPLFDPNDILSRIGGNKQLVREILAGFLEDLPKRFVLLKEAIRQKDAAKARRHAHSVKGAAMNIQALALKNIAGNIEETAQTGQLDQSGQLVPQLEHQFQLLKNEIENY